MRVARISFYLLSAVLAACGSVRDRGACVVNGDCPAGQYCVTTADRGACVADAVPPTVSGVSLTCFEPGAAGTTCLRDGVLRVQATVTDDREVAGAEASFDVGGPPVPLVRGTGNVWTADVRLAKLPFGYFEHAVLTTVTAHDTAGNGVTVGGAAGGVAVTRRLWSATLGASLVAPSISAAGVLAVPSFSGKVHFVSWDGQSVGSVELTPNTPQNVTAATASNESFWVGADDGNVYELVKQNAVWSANSRGNTQGSVRGSLALTSNGTIVAGSAVGTVYAITRSTFRNGTRGGAMTVGPVLDATDSIFAVASGTARRLHLDDLGFPTDDWGSVALNGTVSDPLACTTSLFAMANTGASGVVRRVTAVGEPESIATTAVPTGGVVILSDASIIAPEEANAVSRWTSTGSPYAGWQKADLGAATRTPLVLTATVPFIVPTAKGAIHALRPDGTIAWSAQLSAGTASLQPGNIYTPPGQAAGEELSTAYFAGADGVLHAVIVDGTLDTAAPWPKVFHDPQNTNRAGAQP